MVVRSVEVDSVELSYLDWLFRDSRFDPLCLCRHYANKRQDLIRTHKDLIPNHLGHRSATNHSTAHSNRGTTGRPWFEITSTPRLARPTLFGAIANRSTVTNLLHSHPGREVGSACPRACWRAERVLFVSSFVASLRFASGANQA